MSSHLPIIDTGPFPAVLKKHFQGYKKIKFDEQKFLAGIACVYVYICLLISTHLSMGKN